MDEGRIVMNEGRIVSKPDHSCEPPADLPPGTVWECGCGWRWTSKGHTAHVFTDVEPKIEYPACWWRESRRKRKRRMRREARNG